MLFIKNADLKEGMRLAKPIYNKSGVLLFDRNSKLTSQGIDSVKNFGLIGLYILEPAEPLPPMSEEDIEFERFQTVAVFQIMDELNAIIKTGKAPKINMLTAELIKRFGRLNHKINFVQNLRSNEDYIFKHALNSATLCALMSHVLNIKLEDQNAVVLSALVYSMGKLKIPAEIAAKGQNLTVSEQNTVAACQRAGIAELDTVFSASPAIKRTCMQTFKTLSDFKEGKPVDNKTVITAKILTVAEMYDDMTAMNDYEEPASEIAALKFLQQNPDVFDRTVVDSLVGSINFLSNGCCVELNNGQKALVISASDSNVLEPMVLCFSDNSIIDLSNKSMYEGIEIKDVMKTMDNRVVIDPEMMKKYGVN